MNNPSSQSAPLATRLGSPGRRNRRGFTLIEASLATVIIGLGVLASMQLLAAGTVANTSAAELTTASNLANNINEWSQRVAYANLPATFRDKTFSPPKDALGANLTEFGGWQQVVDVQYVDPNRITSPVPDAQQEPTARVVVTLMKNNKEVLRTTFLRCASQWPS